MEDLMNNDLHIRMATPDDAAACLDLYTPFVHNTAVTSELEPPSLDEFARRIRTTIERYPYLVAVLDGRVVGYAYARPFKSRAGYAGSVEVSVYVNPAVHKHGVGRALYSELDARLARQGVTNLYAYVACAQVEGDPYLTDASMCFHKRMGYKQVGLLHGCVRKFGRAYDVAFMEKLLG